VVVSSGEWCCVVMVVVAVLVVMGKVVTMMAIATIDFSGVGDKKVVWWLRWFQ
jgi:hypothetical protein